VVDELPDNRLARIARRQHGAFSREQAFRCGFTDRMVTRRLASRRWLKLDGAVYALTSHPFTWERQAMAATLSVPGALVSGRSAAALQELAGFRPGALEVSVHPERRGRSALARVRRTDFLQGTRVRNIPCLTVAHTIISLAGRVSPEQLDEAVDDALVRRLVDLDELQDRFATWAPRRRPGVATLRHVLERKGGSHVPPTSKLERILRAFLSAPGLPEFHFEYELSWWPPGEGRVDAYAPAHSLIVEADGRAWHTRETEMVRDRQRDNLATAHGHATLRFTWIDLTRYADENHALLRQTVEARRPRIASEV
jgi:very-short-patch-repair endonuclease